MSLGWSLSHTSIGQPVMKVFVFSLSETIVTSGSSLCPWTLLIIVSIVILSILLDPHQ